MKRMLLAACLILASASATLAQDVPVVYSMNTHAVGDTVLGATTMLNSKKVTDKKSITVEATATRVTDTITVTLSVWGSVDGITYAPWPGADSLTTTLLAANTPVSKMWFLSVPPATSQVQFYQVRARCASNTTNASSKAAIRSRIYCYK